MAAPDFWDNQEAAGKVIGEQKRARANVGPIRSSLARLEDLELVLELAGESDDDEEALSGDLETGLAELEKDLEAVEFQVMLGGEHDHRNALLTLQAGTGGIDAFDWTEMLMRMYLRYCERKGFTYQLLDEQKADEAGIKSASIMVKGAYAYGYLKAEQGVHRLVRISPFDSQSRRQTSFASLEVVPELDDDIAIELVDKDIRVDTYRASGAGGQHVNKTDSAVRLTHLPTGCVVACQNERSQHKNRATAQKMLKAKLYQLEQAKREEELASFYGDRGAISWGNQIRSYVLAPYQLVKDLRTSVETGNTQAVLDGDLENFISAWLKRKK